MLLSGVTSVVSRFYIVNVTFNLMAFGGEESSQGAFFCNHKRKKKAAFVLKRIIKTLHVHLPFC